MWKSGGEHILNLREKFQYQRSYKLGSSLKNR